MPHKKAAPVKTPTIDKLVAQHDDQPLEPTQEVCSYIIHQHFIFIAWRMFTQFLVLLPFGLIVFFLPANIASATEVTLLQICFGFILLNTILGNYIYWRLNAALVFSNRLDRFYFRNLLRQRHESFEMKRLNTFDLSRTGLLSYIFNYADLNLSTMIKDAESADTLSIKRARKPERALQILKSHALK